MPIYRVVGNQVEKIETGEVFNRRRFARRDNQVQSRVTRMEEERARIATRITALQEEGVEITTLRTQLGWIQQP